MGGLGKTVVAQLVYEDDSIVRNFDLRAWVCVSATFDIDGILSDIVESITKKECETSIVDVLANQVKEKLSGKKYLLVLDDLWNENVEYWEKLKRFLIYGSRGSKILVTTRNQMVASVVGSENIYNLKKLSDDVCWSIMKDVLSPGGGLVPPEMINTGKVIAEKCDGLPLAAKAFGLLLRSNKTINDWLLIASNNEFESTPEYGIVISVLKLSYDNLTSPLKRCFSYCCIFPKDWIIHRETLIRLWMAEGFLPPSNKQVNGRSAEDIGDAYFEHLLWNSFFQDVEKDELGVTKTCKMHDWVHYLALSVADKYNDFAIGKATVPLRTRHLQLICDKEASAESPVVFSNAAKVWTVVALNPEKCSQISSFFSNNRLRILCPLGDWETKLSSSIPKLKYLRYLDLSNCEIDLVHDVSLNHLYNLQTLVLRRCINISKLLTEIGSLENLRHLDISSSDINVLPYSIIYLTDLQSLNLNHCRDFEALPLNIGALKQLKFLDISYTRIKELPESITCIDSIRKLKFDHCEKLKSLPSELGALTRLRCLDLSSTNINELPESCISNLCNLEMVKLEGKGKLPKEITNWAILRFLSHCRYDDEMPMGIERLIFLKSLTPYMVRKEEFLRKNNCRSGIEELAGLNYLQELHIKNLENVGGGIDTKRAKLMEKKNLQKLNLYWGSSKIADEDSISGFDPDKDGTVLQGLQPHPNLRELRIEGFLGSQLPNWMMASFYCLPNLAELFIENCESCEQLPALGMLPCLMVLKLWGMKSVKFLGEEFYYQQESSTEREEDFISEIQDATAATPSALYPSLIQLSLGDMPILEEWVAPPYHHKSFPFLKSLLVSGCLRLRSVPPFTSFASLKSLVLRSTNDNAVSSILAGKGEGGKPSCLTSLSIQDSPQFMFFPVRVLQNNARIQSLEIAYCSGFQGFRILNKSIYNKDDREKISSDTGFNQTSLSSLCSLKLIDCPALTSLPDLRKWTSLTELWVEDCDKLKKSFPYDLASLPNIQTLYVDCDIDLPQK